MSVSTETGNTVRSFLAEYGMKTWDLPKFIEEVVRWRVFDQALAAARRMFNGVTPAVQQASFGDAVAAAHACRVPSGGQFATPAPRAKERISFSKKRKTFAHEYQAQAA